MAEDEEEAEPQVELGEGASVEGAPLGRVASRLTWPRSRSDIILQEGETPIRTGDGPQSLESILDDTDTPHFATRQEFVATVREVIGYGPVPTTE